MACADPGAVYEGSADVALRLLGFGRSGRLFEYAYVVDGPGRYGGHGPAERYGRSRADVLVPDALDRDDDVRVPFDGLCRPMRKTLRPR